MRWRLALTLRARLMQLSALWTICWLLSDHRRFPVVCALTAIVIGCALIHPAVNGPVLSYAKIVAWCNQVRSSGKICITWLVHALEAITSAYITGTSASLSCFSWSPASLLDTWSRLQRSYVMAATPPSIKTQSDKFSDL